MTKPTSKHAFAVTGDNSRMIYSMHTTRAAAERACRALSAKWGRSHPGSEPRVIEYDTCMEYRVIDTTSGHVVSDGDSIASLAPELFWPDTRVEERTRDGWRTLDLAGLESDMQYRLREIRRTFPELDTNPSWPAETR